MTQLSGGSMGYSNERQCLATALHAAPFCASDRLAPGGEPSHHDRNDHHPRAERG